MTSKKNMLRKFLGYCWGTLIHPKATFREVLSESMPIAYGSAAVLLVGALYTITTVIGYLNGFGAYSRPFLPIAANEYYLYQPYFTILVFWICTLVFAAVTQFFAAFLGGRGKFEDCVAIAGFSLFITILPFMWLPETVMFAFNLHLPGEELVGTIGLHPLIDLFLRQGGTVLWELTVTLIGLKTVHELSWIKTFGVGLAGFAVFEAVFWTYIR